VNTEKNTVGNEGCRTRHRGGPQINLLVMEKEQISGIRFF